MSRQNEQIWTTLLQAGLVQGLEPETGNLETPWYVKLLLAFSGWLAAGFLLGFISAGFQFIMKSNVASFITGSMMIGGAYAILRMQKNEFYEHLALAVSMAGQALIVFAIFDIARSNHEIAWMLVALLQTPLALLMPNFVHRVFSSFIAAYAFSMALTSMGTPFVFNGVVMFLAAWLWLNEFHYPQHMRKIRAIGYGLVLALIQLTGSALFVHGTMHNQSKLWVQPWMGEILLGVVTLYIVWQLLQRYGQVISERLAITALLGTLLLCVVSLEAHGITVGIVIMLLGFAGSNRVLLGLGIMSLFFYISLYYYLLDVTLLAKAQTLFIIGQVLIAVRLLRIMPRGKKVDHA